MNRLTSFVVVALLGTSAASAQLFGPPSKFKAAGSNRSWPTFAEGGLALYFAESANCGNVLVIRRSSLTGSWGTPSVVYTASVRDRACGARVSPDGLELFAYVLPPALRQIFHSVRTSTSVPFPGLKPITELASKDDRGPGCVSADGNTLYYWETFPLKTGRYAVRPQRGKPFVDKGAIGDAALSWVSNDQRVGFGFLTSLRRRQLTSTSFTTTRTVPELNGGQVPTYLPETGELIYFTGNSSGGHELIIHHRKDSLVDYSTWKPGGKIDFDIYGRPVDLWILVLAARQQNVPMPPFGILRVGSPFIVLGQGPIPSLQLRWSPVQDPFPATYTLALPTSIPIGAKGYFQALTADRVSQSRGSLTNLVIGEVK